MIRSLMTAFTLIFTLSVIVGCGSTDTQKTAGTKPDDKIDKNLAKLSAEDQKLAREQKICPVAEQPLGSMGVPEKVMVQGKSVFICCSSCEGELKKNADKYLDKLKK